MLENMAEKKSKSSFMTAFAAFGALVISMITAFIQFSPSSTTRVATIDFNSEYNRDNLTIGVNVNFINTGNRPNIITNAKIILLSDFELSYKNFGDDACKPFEGQLSDERTWDTAMYEGKEKQKAGPITIKPQSALSAHYQFLPFFYEDEPPYFIERFVCLRYEMMSYDGEEHILTRPFGKIEIGGGKAPISFIDGAKKVSLIIR